MSTENQGTEEAGAPITASFIEIEPHEASDRLPAGIYIKGLDGTNELGEHVLRGPFADMAAARKGVVDFITQGVLAGIGVTDVGDGTIAEFADEDPDFIDEDEVDGGSVI
jgi:hypothetical protein